MFLISFIVTKGCRHIIQHESRFHLLLNLTLCLEWERFVDNISPYFGIWFSAVMFAADGRQVGSVDGSPNWTCWGTKCVCNNVCMKINSY